MEPMVASAEKLKDKGLGSQAPGIAGVVLAGGKSSRMGMDKTVLKIGGQTLTARSVAKLRKAGFWPLLVIGPSKAYGLKDDVIVWPDDKPGLGPLGGIETALRLRRGPALVISCDMPFLPISLLKRLKKLYLRQPGNLVCMSPRGLQPLVGVYTPSLLPTLKRRLKQKKLSLHGLCAGEEFRFLFVLEEKPFFNLNSPQELSQMRFGKAN